MVGSAPLSEKQIRALEQDPRQSGLVRRLLATLRREQELRVEATGRLAEIRSDLGELERARPDVDRVLVLIHGDGYVEAFAERWVSVHIANLPQGEWEFSKSADRVTEKVIPGAYRDVWWPGKLRANGNVRCPSVMELKAAKYERVIASAIDEADRLAAAAWKKVTNGDTK